jgi:hypothetical protein
VVATTLATPPPKLRYRSLRRKSGPPLNENRPGTDQRAISTPATQSVRKCKSFTAVGDAEIARRLRAIPDVPPVPASPLSAPELNGQFPSSHVPRKEIVSTRVVDVRKQVANKLGVQHTRAVVPPGDDWVQQWNYNREREAAELRRKEEEEAAEQAQTRRILAEQKKKVIARLRLQLDQARPLRTSTSEGRSPLRERFAFFLRSPRSNDGNVPTPSPTSLTTMSSVDDQSRTTSGQPSPSSPKGFIEMGGRGIVPQMDAPTTASNSGERVSLSGFACHLHDI